MEPAKKELIKEIKDLFEDYEEAYVPGEWEAFSKTKSRKRVLFPYWLRIAAVLFLVAGALPFAVSDFFNGDKSQENTALKKAAIEETGTKIPVPGNGNTGAGSNSSSAGGVKEEETYTAGSNAESNLLLADRSEVSGKSRSKNAAINITSTAGSQNGIIKSALDNSATVKDSNMGVIAQSGTTTDSSHRTVVTAQNEVPAEEGQSTMDFLLSEAKSGRTAATKNKEKAEKWNFGLEVMPTVMKSNLNIGAGITTAYRLSKSFSISSGISMVKLESGAVLPQQVPNSQVSFASQSSKTLVAVDANISAIDIPLGIVYNVTKNFYTSVGISYFNIIRDKRNNTYETTTSFYRMDTDPSTGIAETYQAVKSEAVAEPAAEAPMKGNSYLGFFNLSVGRDQRIFKQYHIMVEPFIKIPVGKLSTEDLNLMNSGVKFRLAF